MEPKTNSVLWKISHLTKSKTSLKFTVLCFDSLPFPIWSRVLSPALAILNHNSPLNFLPRRTRTATSPNASRTPFLQRFQKQLSMSISNCCVRMVEHLERAETKTYHGHQSWPGVTKRVKEYLFLSPRGKGSWSCWSSAVGPQLTHIRNLWPLQHPVGKHRAKSSCWGTFDKRSLYG